MSGCVLCSTNFSGFYFVRTTSSILLDYDADAISLKAEAHRCVMEAAHEGDTAIPIRTLHLHARTCGYLDVNSVIDLLLKMSRQCVSAATAPAWISPPLTFRGRAAEFCDKVRARRQSVRSCCALTCITYSYDEVRCFCVAWLAWRRQHYRMSLFLMCAMITFGGDQRIGRSHRCRLQRAVHICVLLLLCCWLLPEDEDGRTQLARTMLTASSAW
jgi:hypothetical protein